MKKLLSLLLLSIFTYGFSYANLYLNGSSTPGNWNGSHITDKYGPRLCSNCHGSGPSNGADNIILTSDQMSVAPGEEITITFGIADGYSLPFHSAAGKIMGVYLMIKDGNSYKQPSEMGWTLIDDPNSNGEKYNYNEKPDGDLVWSWKLQAPEILSDTEFKAYGYVGGNDYEEGEVFTITANVDIDENLPETATLGNYPNPFNPTTTIYLRSNELETGSLVVYNSNGEMVKELFKGNFNKGLNLFSFNGTELNSGVYFVKFKSQSREMVSKIVLSK